MDAINSYGAGYAGQGSAVSSVSQSKPVSDNSYDPNLSVEFQGQGVVTPNAVQQTASSENNPDAKDEGKKQPTDKQIKDGIREINKHANGTEAVFGIHEKTNRVTIKIVDKQTKEVIKEVPPEKTLDLLAKVWEIAGLMVDEKR